MSSALTTALAPTFDWTTGVADLVLTFASGTSPINVAVPTGSYRVLLGAAAVDFLQVVQAAIGTALSGAGRSETCAVTMQANGRVRLTFSASTTVSGTGPAARLLGLASGTGTTHDATKGPKHFAAFVERQASAIVARTAARFKVTGGGESQGWRSGVVVGVCEALRLGFIPSDPTYQSSLGAYQTPAAADLANVGSVGDHDGVWSVTDVLLSSGGKVVAYADGNLQTLLSSTTARYHLGALSPDDVARPRFELDDEAWPAWQRLTLTFTRSATDPTGTRA